MKVRPAALKNEEAQEAREQHADDGAGAALSGYGVMMLHAPTTTTLRRRCQLGPASDDGPVRITGRSWLVWVASRRRMRDLHVG